MVDNPAVETARAEGSGIALRLEASEVIGLGAAQVPVQIRVRVRTPARVNVLIRIPGPVNAPIPGPVNAPIPGPVQEHVRLSEKTAGIDPAMD